MRTLIAAFCLFSFYLSGQFMRMSSKAPDGDSMEVTLGGQVLYSGAAITGAPYSAESTSQQVQTLADGTHITQMAQIIRTWRDSEGRTREERSMGGGGFQGSEQGRFFLIEILDRAAGVMYVIDDAAKIAHRAAVSKPPTSPTPAQPPKGAVAYRPTGSSEKLGERNIEGVIATGTRSTTTMPVGVMGNDRPLTTTNEMWYSQELKTVVLQIHNDPRMGESTTKLTNIVRAEPLKRQ